MQIEGTGLFPFITQVNALLCIKHMSMVLHLFVCCWQHRVSILEFAIGDVITSVPRAQGVTCASVDALLILVLGSADTEHASAQLVKRFWQPGHLQVQPHP